jgi:ketosteroid isomerase-like protein
VADDVVIYTHRVTTRTPSTELDERETIVFRRGRDGAWTAVHEHLSTTPEGA